LLGAPQGATDHGVNARMGAVPNGGAGIRNQQPDLLKALTGLNLDLRCAVVLYDVAGFSYEEAAAIAGMSARTFKLGLGQGRARLRGIVLPLQSGRSG